jgi:hypothetical protein
MKSIFFILCLTLIVAGCKKSSVAPYSSDGILLGVDRGDINPGTQIFT